MPLDETRFSLPEVVAEEKKKFDSETLTQLCRAIADIRKETAKKQPAA